MSEYVRIADCKVTGETERAILVDSMEIEEETFVPKSQLHKDENEIWKKGDKGDLVVSAWWAEKKGWI